MKLPRVSAVVAAAVLAPAVLFPSSAVAADAPQPVGVSGPDTGSEGGTTQEDLDRAEIQRILADKESGVSVREAAERALAAGTAADLRHFLEVGLQDARRTDDRVKAAQILAVGGPAVKAAAQKALRGSYADLVAFLKEGQYAARAEDDRAEIERILADPQTGRGVRETGQAALAVGTPAALRHFLEVELPKQQADDDRVAVTRILSQGGPAVKRAASAALSGTYADVVKFLKEGQYAARAEDDRAEIEVIVADPQTGPHTRRAAQQALEGDAAGLRRFLESELASVRMSDKRVKVSQIAESGGPAVRKAALAALEGTDQAVLAFLEHGWSEARAEDEAAAQPATLPTTRPTARPAEQPSATPAPQAAATTPAVPAAQAPVVQAAARTTTGGGTGTTHTAADTAARPGQLAATGSEGLGWEAGGAAAAVAAGAALVAVSRRRRPTED
ncbi:ALF repeat-containing protein [Kitasatospora sp. NPDC097605]|uniref:ALF repeat-containing protein n=1 Tax=Kitasatospora sp. NPDC097605 TaxID=3157226 RepID=UPI00331DE10A